MTSSSRRAISSSLSSAISFRVVIPASLSFLSRPGPIPEIFLRSSSDATGSAAACLALAPSFFFSLPVWASNRLLLDRPGFPQGAEFEPMTPKPLLGLDRLQHGLFDLTGQFRHFPGESFLKSAISDQSFNRAICCSTDARDGFFPTLRNPAHWLIRPPPLRTRSHWSHSRFWLSSQLCMEVLASPLRGCEFFVFGPVEASFP
jgi:hypothetical protein